ncbi:hypothetical protein SacmaDRAFT_4647 [Saccharomonospora marina XMU15]|uniref:DUF2867 domain-containing protein n=1 Tax=Saccharomonospora marina XMU15 TaxID=882083 RepID=H5WWZ4_9PSEU|nr:hypothetical protein [Saccharomonospora marina]EHR52822.1 hypothetical protein SacmaDRAFT_4647 [Saccharomonospora marina XMU15]
MTQPLLLDEYLPSYDHAIHVSRLFRAPPTEVLDAVADLDLFRLPLPRVLLRARALPGRLADARARRRGGPPTAEPPTFRIRDLPARGWILLGERPGRELVYGQVGKVWRGTGGAPSHPVTADTFADFAEPGFAKLAESTLVTPYGEAACVLTVESRVALTDVDSRRRFRRYWLAAGPFIRLMRPAVMRALARRFRDE